MSFAVSMTEPPPTARNDVGWYAFAKSIASLMLVSTQHLCSVAHRGKQSSAHELSFGSTLVRSNTTNSIPSLVKLSVTCAIASSFETLASVTTQTFFVPMFIKSMPTSLVQPGPNRMLDADISKAYSFCLDKSAGVARDRFT